MKDDSLPPVVKLSDPVIAATFGLTLATKRSTAENVIGESRDKLVIEPFANPFRVYPLTEDYHDFKELLKNNRLIVISSIRIRIMVKISTKIRLWVF